MYGKTVFAKLHVVTCGFAKKVFLLSFNNLSNKNNNEQYENEL